ncbi:peptidyl-prolyl cis-trans isomerase [Prosthecobacter sp. SYSU 5D2]|uniref:peptidylprolyl isomerase n=1 Tax=Prosthecobacter sp. SYSU 5D2 TaxID=3134134 RepID=UPI0031FED004
MTRVLAFAAGAGLVVLTGCSRQAHEEGAVLARVGDVSLSDGDFKQLLQLQERIRPNETEADPKAVLQEWVDREVLVQNAVKAGVREDPKVQEMIRDLLIAEYKQRQLVPELEAVTVTEEEIKAAYEEQQNQFIMPERVRLAILFLSSSSRAEGEDALAPRRRLQSALDMARQAEPEAKAGARKDFGALAASFSEDQETRYRGGDIGWVERERFPARLDPVVIETGFALTEPGQYSDVIIGRAGFYVVKLLDRKPAAPVPLAQATPTLTHQLTEKKKAQVQTHFETGLREGLTVEIHPERLQGLHAAIAEKTPPSIP